MFCYVMFSVTVRVEAIVSLGRMSRVH